MRYVQISKVGNYGNFCSFSEHINLKKIIFGNFGDYKHFGTFINCLLWKSEHCWWGKGADGPRSSYTIQLIPAPNHPSFKIEMKIFYQTNINKFKALKREKMR
jgi:hypothetical protein